MGNNASTDAANPPEQFLCPITQAVMVNPVVDPDGNSFERLAIIKWLETNDTSPITRKPLRADQLVPNRALQAAITTWQSEVSASGEEPGRTVNPEDPASRELLDRAVAAAIRSASAAAPAPAAAAAGAAAATAGAGASHGTTTTTTTTTAAAAATPATTLTMTPMAVPGLADTYDVLVSATPPVGRKSPPVDVCCVVDVSGSMCSSAKAQGVEDAGLSLLDIVKHAVKTIAHVLTPKDRLAVVAYSNTATVTVKLMGMGKRNRQLVTKRVAALSSGGQTNLWDGLHTGMELLRNARKPNRLSTVLLLTDGCPNVTPPRGHMHMLRRYRDEHSWLPCVSTFGFGYSLDSQLLYNLATEGGGMYCFIPDSSFVGTAFVNAISNTLSTYAHNVRLSVEPQNGAELVLAAEGKVEEAHHDYANGDVMRTSWGADIRLHTLLYGQSRDTVVRVKLPAGAAISGGKLPFLCVCLTLDPRNSGTAVRVEAEGPTLPLSPAGTARVALHVARTRVAQTLVRLVRAHDTTRGTKRVFEALQAEVAALAPAARGSPHAKHMQDVLLDVTGQVKMALKSNEFYKRWGCHYLPSLARAHALQQSNNFKDPGVQHYGGALFTTFRDAADATFIKLPPPTPSRAQPTRGGRAAARPRRPVNMAVWHNRGGGCFVGTSMVRMADGGVKPAKDVRAGDRISVAASASASASAAATATVRCVMKTNFVLGGVELVTLPGGLTITPWHPVRWEGKWAFPTTVAGAILRRHTDVGEVFSFAVDAGHVAVIDGVEVICLAHGIKGDSVASHPYFGTQAVLDDLAAMRGWDDGLVELQAPCTVKDPVTGVVCGMVQTGGV